MYQTTTTFKIEEVDRLYGGVPYEDGREAHAGIFTGCVGDFSFDYHDQKAVTPLVLEQLIIDEYAFRNCSFDTFQEFKQHIKTTWNRHIYPLIDALKNVPDLKYNDGTESVTESVESSGNASTSGGGKNKYTNTPNQYKDYADGMNGLTDYSENETNGSSENSGKAKRTLETDRAGNMFEKWLAVAGKNRNIIYDFVDRFAPLFMTTSGIKYTL